MAEAGYNTLVELRAEGVVESDDARLTKAGLTARNYIERMTGRCFEPRQDTLKVDYNPKSRVIFLPEPVLEVTKLTILEKEIESANYVIYNRITPGSDDRDNPKIELISGWTGRNPDRSPFRGIIIELNSRYPLGVSIEGKFGYCDKQGNDWVTPFDIKRVHAMLTARIAPKAMDESARDDRKRERIVSEKTDGHSYTLAARIVAGSVTGIQEIDDVLRFYSRPNQIASV